MGAFMRSLIMGLLACVITAVSCASGGFDYAFRQASGLADAGNYDQAVQQLEVLIERFPERPEPYRLLGSLQYRRGDYHGCIEHYDIAEQKGFQGDYRFYMEKGISFFKTGQMTEAKRSLERSISMNQSPEAGRYLGIILARKGAYSTAVIYLKEAHRSFPDDGELLAAYGGALMKTGNYDEALDILTKACASNPNDRALAFSTGSALAHAGRFADAAEVFDTIPEQHALYGISRYNAAKACVEYGDYKGAIRRFREYLATAPGDYDAVLNMGSAMIKTEDYESAEQAFSMLVERNPNDATALYNRGVAMLHLDAAAQAEKNLAIAAGINPDNANIRYAYGLALTETGKMDQARKEMRTVLTLVPTYENALKWMENYSVGEK